ncbi:5-oxoprolinase/urea amidolyase family protein [Microbacterium binotii]|uniref:5-oxoprolinase subunit B/C family protein n=1 Tax=Microbacterium binotii TaxID=462710 RepID=UPI001F3E09E9|nr:5-oxoprolinase/urea amidolyase family protein [Microbacterium binotii]UIN31091.1 5-oxoprolinase/urea amidolyase family protein [Microbacterium binotii]
MTGGRRVLPFGAGGLLIELEDLDAVLGLHAGLAASVPAGVEELVPAARTVLVRFDPRRVPAHAVRTWIAATDAAASRTDRDAAEVTLPTVYDGPDLAEAGRWSALSAAELVERHVRTPWRVAFTGFAPGFAYLVGEGWDLDIPRLDAPRTRVPAGAVALAAGFTGTYPRATPGGWRIIGTTTAPLFDPDAAAPALLTAGTRVRFRPERTRVELPAPPTPRAPTAPALRIDSPGPLATIQDLGRPGAGATGIAVSGAADRRAAALANRLVGSAQTAAVIEILLGPFRATALVDRWIAVTGGLGAVRIDGRAADPHRAVLWPAGSVLEIGPLTTGLRAYLAVRGGIDAPRSAGSRATDTLAGLGPAPLAAGDEIPTAAEITGEVPPIDAVAWTAPAPGDVILEVLPGPRADWFAADAGRTLFAGPWHVSSAADRIGVRLEGPGLTRIRAGELASEAMLPGALQVPPDGRPVVLGVDGPVTGGYPVIAVATPESLDRLAQARPGTRVRIRPVG